MAEIIKIQHEENKPRVICNHCKQEILIDIMPFANDVTQILRDRCPKCYKEIFVGVLILCHKDMRSLLGSIQVVIDAIQSPDKIIGGKRQND